MWWPRWVPREQPISSEYWYLLSPFIVYPHVMAVREYLSGSPQSPLDWIAGYSNVSIFEPASAITAVVVVVLYATGYALFFVERGQKIWIAVSFSISASIFYFTFAYLDGRFLRDPRNACVGGAGPFCIQFFEHALIMLLAVNLAKYSSFAIVHAAEGRSIGDNRNGRD